MPTTSFDFQISLIETELRSMSIALLDGEPGAIQTTSITLQRLAVGLIQIANEVGRDQLSASRQLKRIRVIASGLVALRENLVRQSAYVERALEVLVPATRQKSTYASGGVYGSSVRRSGEFTAFSA